MTTDYAQMLDDEVLAFIAKTASFYPQDGEKLTLEAQRRCYDAMCADFRQPRPAGLSVTDEGIVLEDRTIPTRRYEPEGAPETTLIYAHGGGFVLGGLDSHDDVCWEFCKRTQCRVIAIDYRLSPEHPFPDDFHDMLAAFDDIAARFDMPLLLSGDSAGSTLVAALAHARRRSATEIAGMLLIYPALGGDITRGSYVEHAMAPGLTLAQIHEYGAWRAGGDTTDAVRDWRAAPLKDTDFSDLPPTVIVTADCDPLRDDGPAYRDALLDAGGWAEWRNEIGLIHGFLRARHSCQKARDSFTFMCDALVRLARIRNAA